MRNIVEYPITVDECLETLVRIRNGLPGMKHDTEFIIGDMRPIILTTIYDFLLENHEEFTKYLMETTDQ